MFILFLVLVCIVFMIILFTRGKSDSNHSSEYNTDEYGWQTYGSQTNSRPKISAEVSDSMHSQIKRYCSSHSMTISDLVRKSVKDYMDSNP